MQTGNENVPTLQSSECLKQSSNTMNGRNKTHENKTNHRLFEMNKNTYLSQYL